MYAKSSVIFCDNQASIEALNILFEDLKINSLALKAVRKPSQKFGILDRQIWQVNIFQNELIKFMPNTQMLLKNLAKQVIVNDPGKSIDKNEKRDESINSEIYDIVNAFEMANSITFKFQYSLLIQKINNNQRAD